MLLHLFFKANNRHNLAKHNASQLYAAFKFAKSELRKHFSIDRNVIILAYRARHTDEKNFNFQTSPKITHPDKTNAFQDEHFF